MDNRNDLDLNNETKLTEETHNLQTLSYARKVMASCTEVGMEDLIMLGTIKQGDTICVSTLSVVVHRSWSTWFWRTLLRESRDKTKAWVELVVDFAVNEILKYRRMNSGENMQIQMNFLDKVCNAKEGIENLAKTYECDAETVRFLNQCSEMLTGYYLGVQSSIASIGSSVPHSNPINIATKLTDFIIVDIEDRSVPNIPELNRSPASDSSTSSRIINWMSSTATSYSYS